MTVAPRIEGVVVAHAQADVLVVARQRRVGAVDLIQRVHQLIVDIRHRAEARSGDLEAARLAGRIAVGVQCDKGVGLIARRYRRGEHVDLDARALEQCRRALGNVEVDLPFLLAAADGAALQPTQLGRNVLVQPVAGLQADAALAWWVVERRGRQRCSERAEEILRTRRPRRG